jgi:hypothetical protein
VPMMENMFSPFQTCWDRVDRAESHRKSLIQIWNALDTDKVYRSEADIDDHGNGKFFLRTVKRDWLLPFSLQFGEMLYHLRAGLDSCVYDAAALEFTQNPPPDEEQWNFPICATKDKFENSVRRMKNLPDRMRRLLEAVQPYSGAVGRAHGQEWDLGSVLYILNEWARIDRHRRLHLVGTAISRGDLGFERVDGMSVQSCDFQVREHVLEHDTEIARFKIANWVPGKKMNVHGKFTFEIVVDEAPRLSKLEEIARAMLMSVIAVRESFDRAYGIVR